MHVKREVVSSPGDDDDDDDDLPPEIRALMEMTEGMHVRHSGKKKKVERTDESKDDIMKRMNDLHEEIGEKHDEKYQMMNRNQDRTLQMLVLSVVVIFILLGSFMIASGSKEEEKKEAKPSRGQKVGITHSD